MPSPLIEIPSDDIFKNDKLGLEPAIASRTQAILGRSPQAIAIDGRWGTGKTTFMALWAAYLRREGVKVVQFNAWKSFEADPFKTLTKEILRQVDIPYTEQEPPHKRLLAFLTGNTSIAVQGAKLVSTLQQELEEVSQTVEVGLQAIGNMTRPESPESPDPKVDSPEAFASLLSSAAKSWSDRPVVVMVDELDRCSPEYSVEMLQLLEHVFHAEHVVFVVAVNLTELLHSVRAFYGQGFNAEGYLERFFDEILPLPTSNRSQYIESSLSAIESPVVSGALPFLYTSGMSLREVDKSIRQLGVAVQTDPERAYALVNLWIARTLAPVEYRQFIRGEISDKALSEAIFEIGACSSLRTERERQSNASAQQLELILIAATLALHNPLAYYADDPLIESELYGHYSEIDEDDINPGDVPVAYSSRVVRMASHISPEGFYQGDVYGILQAIRLLDSDPTLQ